MRNFQIFEPEAITWAAFAARAPFFGGRKNKPTIAQQRGIRYERKAQEHMQALFPDTYIASPWLIFRVKSEPMPRWCQPDGIILDLERLRVTIVEIKLRHMAEAHTQIEGIYRPVLQRIFSPKWDIREVEVTRFYDPAVHFPVPVQLVADLSLVPAHRFAVHIWK